MNARLQAHPKAKWKNVLRKTMGNEFSRHSINNNHKHNNKPLRLKICTCAYGLHKYTFFTSYKAFMRDGDYDDDDGRRAPQTMPQ